MAPDDLHTVFGGLLGHHFVAVMGAVGTELPMGQAAFLSTMDVRLHQVRMSKLAVYLLRPSYRIMWLFLAVSSTAVQSSHGVIHNHAVCLPLAGVPQIPTQWGQASSQEGLLHSPV